MRTHPTCETCGMFDPRPDPEYLEDDYCVETENIVNAGDRACKEYWRMKK